MLLDRISSLPASPCLLSLSLSLSQSLFPPFMDIIRDLRGEFSNFIMFFKNKVNQGENGHADRTGAKRHVFANIPLVQVYEVYPQVLCLVLQPCPDP